jgi:hypothetical protein
MRDIRDGTRNSGEQHQTVFVSALRNLAAYGHLLPLSGTNASCVTPLNEYAYGVSPESGLNLHQTATLQGDTSIGCREYMSVWRNIGAE